MGHNIIDNDELALECGRLLITAEYGLSAAKANAGSNVDYRPALEDAAAARKICRIVLAQPGIANNGDFERFTDMGKRAKVVLDGLWKIFGLCVLESVATGHQVIVKAEEVTPAKPTITTKDSNGRMTAQTREAIVLWGMGLGHRPKFAEVQWAATNFGCSETTIYRILGEHEVYFHKPRK